MDVNRIMELTDAEIAALSQEQMEIHCKALSDDVAKRENALRQFYDSYSDIQIRARESRNKYYKDFEEHIRTTWTKAHDSKSLESNHEKIEKLRIARKRIAKYQGIIAAGNRHAIAVQKDGTVINNSGDILPASSSSKWKNVIAVACQLDSIYALKSDGTFAGNKERGRDTVAFAVSIGIGDASGSRLELSSEGTVHAYGFNKEETAEISGWRNIVAIKNMGGTAIGLKSDGTCTRSGRRALIDAIEEWKDIVGISAWCAHVVGVKSDGTCVAAGNNNYGQCNVSSWRNVIAVYAGTDNTIGITIDGKVLATGLNTAGKNNVQGWSDIVAIAPGCWFTIGLKSDGTVVTVGDESVYRWNNICHAGRVKITDDMRKRRKQGKSDTMMDSKTKSKISGWISFILLIAFGFVFHWFMQSNYHRMDATYDSLLVVIGLFIVPLAAFSAICGFLGKLISTKGTGLAIFGMIVLQIVLSFMIFGYAEEGISSSILIIVLYSILGAIVALVGFFVGFVVGSIFKSK